MDPATSVASFSDISASANPMAANRPASATSTVKMSVSDEMEPANFPLPASPAPEIATPAELDPANYPLPESPMPGRMNSFETETGTGDPNFSCFLLRSAPSTRTKSGEDGFAKPVAGSSLLEVNGSSEVVSTEFRDFKLTGSPSPNQAAFTGSVSNVLASTDSTDCEPELSGTSAGSEPTSGEPVQTNSKSTEAELSGKAASGQVQQSETVSLYRNIRDLLLSILEFFGLIAPRSAVLDSLQSELSAASEFVDEVSSLLGLPAEPSPVGTTVPDPSSAVAAPPLAHFIRDEEGWVHRFERGIRISSFKPKSNVAEIPDGLTLGQALDTYKAVLVKFKESRSCAEITELLENTLLKLPTLQISSCIASGLGTFTAPHPYCRENPEISLLQLAALEFMLGVLRRKFTICKAYIQDPVMSILDEQLVTSLGFTVLHDPDAMNFMTPTTFLYAPINEFSVVADFLLVASPALYLGNELAFYRENIMIIPKHIRDEYASRNIHINALERSLFQGEKVWDEYKGKELSKKELVDAYIYPCVQKARKTLLDYEHGRQSRIWTSWADQMVYWAED